MAHGRRKGSWHMFSHHLAQQANLNRSKNSSAKSPNEFNPYHEQKTQQAMKASPKEFVHMIARAFGCKNVPPG